VRESGKGPKEAPSDSERANEAYLKTKRQQQTAFLGRIRKWWPQITWVLTSLFAILAFLILHWPFNQSKDSPNQSKAETNNGAIVYGPVQNLYNGPLASPSAQSSVAMQMTPAPTATPSQTIMQTPAPTVTAFRPEGQNSDLSEGLKKVLRAASVNFSNLRGDLIGGQETFGKVYTYKGILIFDHASFAQCTTSASDDWAKLWYSYTIFYEPTSNEDSDRKMSDLRERLGYILTTYNPPTRPVLRDDGGEYFTWQLSDSVSEFEPLIQLTKKCLPGGLESQVSLKVEFWRSNQKP